MPEPPPQLPPDCLAQIGLEFDKDPLGGGRVAVAQPIEQLVER